MSADTPRFVVTEMVPLEIWIRIIHLFQISFSGLSNFARSLEESDSDNIDKRHTLLSLALTHPRLTDITLDELWKSMNNLKPVTGLAISPYDEFSSTYLNYEDGYGCWVS